MLGQRQCPYCKAVTSEVCGHLALAVEGRDFVRKCVELCHAQGQWRELCAQHRGQLHRSETHEKNRGIMLEMQFLRDEGPKMAISNGDDLAHETFEMRLHGCRQSHLDLLTPRNLKANEAAVAEIKDHRAVRRQNNVEISAHPEVKPVFIQYSGAKKPQTQKCADEKDNAGDRNRKDKAGDGVSADERKERYGAEGASSDYSDRPGGVRH